MLATGEENECYVMAIDSGNTPPRRDQPGLGAEIRALRDSVEEKLRSRGAEADQLDSLERALEELRVGWENLQGQSEQLTREREHYAELFRLAPEAYVVTDTYGSIGDLNLAARELLGFGSSNLVGKPLELFVTMEHRKTFRTRLNAMLAQREKTAQTWSGSLNRGNFPPLSVEFTVGAIRSHGGTVRLCWVLRCR